MKKLALSLLVIAGTGAYVWQQSGANTGPDLLGSTALGSGLETPSAPRKATTPEPAAPAEAPPPVVPGPVEAERGDRLVPPPGLPATLPESPAAPSPPPSRSARDNPLPRPRPSYFLPGSRPRVTRAAMTVASNNGYADGTYTGPAVDAYYGLVQIQAVVQGGRLVGVKVLQYPSDRRTSVAINRQALPMLRDEVVSAQSANVDIISGATLTSEAFIRSLNGALNKSGQ